MESSVVERLFSVHGKTALITGAAAGLGQQFSLFLAEAGANVIVTDCYPARLPGVVEEIEKLGKGRAHAAELDVGWGEQKISAAVGEAWDVFGRIDILINNAGLLAGAPLAIDATVDQFDRQFHVNVKGLWLVTKAVTERQLADGKGGSIINLSGISAQVVVPGSALYSATKAAVSSLTEHFARDLGPYKIRVNSIAPGIFPTDMTKNFEEDPAKTESMRRIPLGRMGDTRRELNGTVLLLASEAGSYVTGATIPVTGGYELTHFAS